MNHPSVAIVGCGTVGGATARHLLQHRTHIRERYGLDIRLSAVVDRDLRRARALGLPEELLTDDLARVLEDDSVATVIELVGGIEPAERIILQAFEAGKDVVTANKALLAHRGADLFAAARAAGRVLAFEASCGGGIPLIRALYDGLAGNRIHAIYGIVNGTCNYILTQMIERSISYGEALEEAQEAGLAEADPTLDVTGLDSAHKIAIMASIGFGVRVDVDSVPVMGIDALSLADVTWATRLGYVPKLLATAEQTSGAPLVRVRPSFVPRHHPLAWVSGPFNAVSIYGYPTGHTMYYGRGAGGSATAGAIVADVIAVAGGTYRAVFDRASFWPDRSAPAGLADSHAVRGRYYVRATVVDRPGVLAEMTAHYGRHGISIASVHQDEIADDEDRLAPVVVVTHAAGEDNLLAAVAEIDALEAVREPCAVIPIVHEPDEQLI